MRLRKFIFAILALLLAGEGAEAFDYLSPNFILRDPIISMGGGFSASTTFQYFSSLTQTVIGENTSSVFRYRSGFLYFPTITSPILTVTPGPSRADLLWTAAEPFLGFTVSSYEIGQAIASGGPYTFAEVGNVFATQRLGLTNGVRYYFVVRVRDPDGFILVTSDEVSAVPAETPPVPGVGGPQPPILPAAPVTATVQFSGRAFPNGEIFLLKDGRRIATTTADADASFTFEIKDLSLGNYLFGIFGQDEHGRRSSLTTIPLMIDSNETRTVQGIFLSPTLSVDKQEVKQGDLLMVDGQTAPLAEVTVLVRQESEVIFTDRKEADARGDYHYEFDTGPFDFSEYRLQTQATIRGQASALSPEALFVIGAVTVFIPPGVCAGRGDLNSDCRINLVDFSIAAYWHQLPLPESFAVIERERLNNDHIVNLTDFSILAFYWTG
ncbi:hypothetical protein HY628_02465 [Candidatus Uhrbacteria bacterium]|nr:hypothetical protein [Candidatus Uhrbacteria bacterium]